MEFAVETIRNLDGERREERSEESPVISFDAPYLCLSLFVYSNMLSQSLQFAFPCRNSFFIRSSVECSPLELSSL